MDSQKYLVPLDFTDVTLNALTYGLQMAKENNDKLAVLHIVASDKDIDSAQAKLNQLLNTLSEDERSMIEGHIKVGDVFNDMGNFAKELKTSLILMATHGEKGLRYPERSDRQR